MASIHRLIRYSGAKISVLAGVLLTIGLSGCLVVSEPPTGSTATDERREDPLSNTSNQPSASSNPNRKAPSAQGNTGELRVVYYPTKRRFSQELQQIYQKTGIFQRLADVIDNKIALPRTVNVELAECGFENAFYEPAKHRIVMCYELTQYFINLFKRAGLADRQAGENALYATVFTFFHESGHMLANELELPITGREEDAADQFSTLMLTTSAGDTGQKAAEAAALWFSLTANRPTDRTQFMDEHSLDQQRFYAIICLLYGSNPNRYEPVVRRLGFPQARVQKCRREYEQTARAWKALLAPHMRNPRS